MACCINIQTSIESGDIDAKALALKPPPSARYKKTIPDAVWTNDVFESPCIEDDSGILSNNQPSPTPSSSSEKITMWTNVMTATRTKEDSSRWEMARCRFSRWSRRRSSIKDRASGVSCGGGKRRSAPRQRSMSLDAAEDLWASAKKASDLLSTSNSPSTSPNLQEQSSKTNRLLRRYRFGGSLHKNRSRNTLSGSDFNGSGRDRLKRASAHLQAALFDAVEDGDIVRVQELLNDSEVSAIEINSVNSDELTCLDTAMLAGHASIARLLMSNGARENMKLHTSAEHLEDHIEKLYSEADQNVSDLKVLLNTHLASNSSPTSLLKESEKSLIHWQLRKNLFSQMRNIVRTSHPPPEPESLTLNVSSESSILISFLEPADRSRGLATRYKVEWSEVENFGRPCGWTQVDEHDSELVLDGRFGYRINIENLTPGVLYYFRVSSGNFRGYSNPVLSTPSCGRPSNWKEVNGFKRRSEGKIELMNELFNDMKNVRLPDAPEIKDEVIGGITPVHARKLTVKKSLKYIFAAAPKFLRTVKRGVYLAALIVHEDKLLITNEETIPLVEVDEEFSQNSILNDYYWLIKIACTWKDVRSLRIDLEKSSSSGSMQFRYKLLQATVDLQSAIGIQDLGQFYHKPIKDKGGAIVLVTINYLKSCKNVSLGQFVKWTAFNKVSRRSESGPGTDQTALDMILDIAPELISYHRASNKGLSRGLYLGYLKLYSSMELIQIMTSTDISNVLPYVKIRDCPNVTGEEWKGLKNLNPTTRGVDSNNKLSEAQINFQQSIATACVQLLKDLGEQELESHRIYDVEVIEINSEVSFILMLPRVHNVCALPGQTERANPGCMMLPMQVFEMIHMRTYQYEFISRYSRLSTLLEIDIHLAQQKLRQAFSVDEMGAARHRLERLSDLQQRLDDTWKSVRWTMDIIGFARDRNLRGGVPLKDLIGQNSLFTVEPSPNNNNLIAPSANGASSESHRVNKCTDKISTVRDRNEGRKNGCEGNLNKEKKMATKGNTAELKAGQDLKEKAPEIKFRQKVNNESGKSIQNGLLEYYDTADRTKESSSNEDSVTRKLIRKEESNYHTNCDTKRLCQVSSKRN